MKRRAVGVLIAVALTLVGTLMLVSYVQGADKRAVAGEKLVDVLVVAQPVKKGTAASALNGKVKLERVPARVRPETAVTSLASLRGLVATADLALGETLVRGRFGKADSLDVSGRIDTSNLIKLTASLDAERAVGGQLKAGDTVVVVISAEAKRNGEPEKVTRVKIHQVPVVAVAGAVATAPSEEDKAEEAAGKSGSNTKVQVTLAFNQEQAAKFVWGLEHGSIWLGLEPAEADQSQQGTVFTNDVFG
jgi:pilus assembly protein CpaB